MPERLWPFPAQTPVTEVLEWSTDVLVTEAAEQRIALRTGPRSTLTLSHILDAAGPYVFPADDAGTTGKVLETRAALGRGDHDLLEAGALLGQGGAGTGSDQGQGGQGHCPGQAGARMRGLVLLHGSSPHGSSPLTATMTDTACFSSGALSGPTRARQ